MKVWSEADCSQHAMLEQGLHEGDLPLLRRQHLVYLTFMNYTILLLQLLPGGFLAAGRDLWISFSLSTVAGMMIAWLVWRFDRQFPGQGLLDVLREKLPFAARAAILLVTTLYTALLCALTTTQLSAFIDVGFLQETPLWVIALLFVLTATHALRKGLEDIANVAAVLSFLTIVSGTTMSFAITGNRHVDNLLPIGATGVGGILMGTLYCLPVWVELFLIPLLPRKASGRKGWLSAYIFIVLLNFSVLIGHAVSPVYVFGMEQTLNLQFPLLSSVKTISLGYIDRFDVYGLALMIFGAYIRVSTYLVLTWMQVQSLFRVRIESWTVAGVTVAGLMTSTLLLFPNSPVFHALASHVFVYVALGMLVFFMGLYLALGLASGGPSSRGRSGNGRTRNRGSVAQSSGRRRSTIR